MSLNSFYLIENVEVLFFEYKTNDNLLFMELTSYALKKMTDSNHNNIQYV